MKYLVISLSFILCVNSSFADKSVEQYRIDHARADLEFYKARKQTVAVVLKKTQRQLEHDRLQLHRYEKIHGAVSSKEVEQMRNKTAQTTLNVEMLESRLVEADAEIKQAEARLGIAIAQGEQPLVARERDRDLRGRRDSWKKDHERLESLMGDTLLANPLPK